MVKKGAGSPNAYWFFVAYRQSDQCWHAEQSNSD